MQRSITPAEFGKVNELFIGAFGKDTPTRRLDTARISVHIVSPFAPPVFEQRRYALQRAEKKIQPHKTLLRVTARWVFWH